jgi:biopolymer transport protein ExbB
MFVMEAFKEGGWGMYPILLLCIITVYLTVERATYLAKCKIDADRLLSLLKSQIVSGNIRGAITTCQSTPAPLTKIIAAGLSKAGSSEHEI